ncbi:MAG TPA: 2,3,4,5-tetrahydropyridine-2,6-dicarboxylate N-succinyltransferase [Myxococcales bacterium]|nr:2,3,4,5-tetrahydropyridine-2,6-dicarboxylate N-succinyltransferase [Myxococcales bacterium]
MRNPADPSLRLPEASSEDLQKLVQAAVPLAAAKQPLQGDQTKAVREVVDRLDKGALRVAERVQTAERWQIHGWVQQAINLYFGVVGNELYEAGDLRFFDKIPPKQELSGFRVVPPGVVRYGAHVEAGAIVMPGYVNIGARVGKGSMVDTWATVGSCAQVGQGVHLSGGVGLGGVLEPPGARPVIIEDGAFVGSRCVVVEGVLVEEEAVLGAGVVLTSTTAIYDVTGPTEQVLRGRVPARSVVIPGMRPRKFPAGEYLVPCALIIGERKESTDKKTSLNTALRDFGVSA